MSEEAKWYVVHTYSGYENKVASNLEKTVENRQIAGSDPGDPRAHRNGYRDQG